MVKWIVEDVSVGHGDQRAARPATGAQRVLSASRVNPLDAASRGVKVYDDGRKMVYEVASSSIATTTAASGAAGENGWSSEHVDQLMQWAAGGGSGGVSGVRSPGYVVVTPPAYTSPTDGDDMSPPSCAPPSVPSSPPAQVVVLQRDARLGMMPPPASPSSAVVTSQPRPSGHHHQEENEEEEVGDAPLPQASAEHPVTMVFLGYQDVEDLSESRRLLGFHGGVAAEVVLIDEDDERSLREKTVTDVSLLDGTAADLVSGRPASSEDVASSQLSSDAPAPPSSTSSASSPPAPVPPPPGLTPATGTDKRKRCECCVLM
ncbi:hypothetical protein CRUP_018288 [Coryphaenoides rupestris]|nr:hypothetical protein CRUP_018288 [Coryphaenoides rupestris]